MKDKFEDTAGKAKQSTDEKTSTPIARKSIKTRRPSTVELNKKMLFEHEKRQLGPR